MDGMSLPDAIALLKSGQRVRRAAWRPGRHLVSGGWLLGAFMPLSKDGADGEPTVWRALDADWRARDWEAFEAPRVETKMAKGLNFSDALVLLKGGLRMARSGWNGRDMYVVRQKGYPDGIPINKNTSEAIGLPEGTVARFLPYLMMRAADGAFVPWLASQTDLMAEDWQTYGTPDTISEE